MFTVYLWDGLQLDFGFKKNKHFQIKILIFKTIERMKKLIVTLTIAVLAIACGEKNDEFVLNGTLRGDVADDTKVFLKTQGENNTIIEVDTVTVTETD